MAIDVAIRDLTTIDEFRQVVALEQAIWGYTDTADLVTVPVFIFTVHRGATLLGAFDTRHRMVGFAYAVMGMKDQRPMQWSHMAGVLPEFRGGLGYRLKLAQRERALSQGLDLIEWTFDPLQAMNAHFNFAKLGGVVGRIRGELLRRIDQRAASRHAHRSPRPELAHRRASRVRRLEQSAALRARAHDVAEAPIVNPTELDGQWRKVASIDLSLDDRRVWIEIPDRVHRDAAAGADARAAVAHGSAADVRDVFRPRVIAPWISCCSARQGFGRYLLAKPEIRQVSPGGQANARPPNTCRWM